MTNQEIVENIESMFDAQLDTGGFCEALEKLQVELIGADALKSYRSAKFKAYQDSHKWLYPEVYGPVPRPKGGNRIISNAEMAELMRPVLAEIRERFGK